MMSLTLAQTSLALDAKLPVLAFLPLTATGDRDADSHVHSTLMDETMYSLMFFFKMVTASPLLRDRGCKGA